MVWLDQVTARPWDRRADRTKRPTCAAFGLAVAPGRRVVAVLVGCVLTAGCTNTVVRPPPADEHVAAFLLDHGQHASLVLEHDRGLARYTYGEWAYYAEGHKGSGRAAGTLFGANEAGLGRRRLPGPPAVAAVRRQLRVRVEHAWRIDVPAERAALLGERFDALFADATAKRTYNPRYDLAFVRHPSTYHLGNNSNHMVGQWLRRLGCEVSLASPFSVWSVRDPPALSPPR